MAGASTKTIILAGGKSSRMGQDKALLPYNGMTLLEHAIVTMWNLTPEIIVVVDRANKYALSGVQMVVDVFPESGPVAGIITGLMTAGEGAHFVVPCDMPTLSRPIFELLRKAADAPVDAVVPEFNGEPEPLCAVYKASALPKLMQYLESGERSARGALGNLFVKRVGEGVLRRADPDFAGFANVNTPEELARLSQP